MSVAGIALTKVSGETVTVAGSISASVSGQPVKVSGETVLAKATALTTGRTRADLAVTAASGGVALASGDVISCTVKMHLKGSGQVSQSGMVWIGISEAPSSGVGFALYPGDSLTIPIDNMNKVRACALLSGETITYIGSQY